MFKPVITRHDLYMTGFLVVSVLEVALLELHDPIGLVLILPWAYLLIKLARSQ